MTSKNEHTGDKLQTKPASEEYRENYDKIFGKRTLTPTQLRREYEKEQMFRVNSPSFEEWLETNK